MTTRRRLTVPMAVVIAAIFGYWLRGCVAVDSCLDSGGRWNEDWGVCERLIEDRVSEAQ